MAAPDFPLWPFSPNWSGAVTETLTWLTDILQSKTGAEQRRSIRPDPKKQIEFTILLSKIHRAFADNLLTGNGAHDWMVPLWWDVHNTTALINSNSKAILLDTALLGEFRVGGWAVIVADDPRDHEIVQIASVSSTRIITTDPITGIWSAGTQVIPIQQARFTDQPQLSRKTDSVSTGSLRFEVQESNARVFGIEFVDSPMIVTGLVARHYQPQTDGQFDPASGTADAQVSMITAMFNAADALSLDPADIEALETGDFYRLTALNMLDALVGNGDERGAITRQAVTGDVNQIVLPHWLYAARGDVPGRASEGEGYDLVNVAGRLRAGFASAAPEVFRDLDIALEAAALNDNRSGMSSFWSTLRRTYRRTNLIGRDHGDNREIFKPLPGLPVVPTRGEPAGMYVASNHPLASADTNTETGTVITGTNFVTRLNDGNIAVALPDSIIYEVIIDPDNPENFPVPDEQGNTAEPANTTIIKPFPTTSFTTVARYTRDRYRAKTSYQNQDFYVFLQISINRNMLPDLGESIKVALEYQGTAWRKEIGPSGLGGDGIRTFLIPMAEFKTDQGASLPVGQVIEAFRFDILQRLGVGVRIQALRILSGTSAAAVTANVNLAFEGEDIPFRPGANPYRISADVKRQTYEGFVGSPYLGAQRPDMWVLIRDEAKAIYSNLKYNQLTLANVVSGAITHNMSEKTGKGLVKTPDALLCEQNVIFIDYCQQNYQNHGGKLGPFAHTFVINTEDRRFFGDPTPHTFTYGNYFQSDELFDQARVVESLARVAFSATLVQSSITYKGAYVKRFGDNMVFGKVNSNTGRLLTAQETEIWSVVLDRSTLVANRFLNWYTSEIPSKDRIVYLGQPVDFKNRDVYLEFNNIDRDLKLVDKIPDPRIAIPYYNRPSPHTAAVILRATMMLRGLNAGSLVTYEVLISKCWRYLDAFWETEGEMAYAWSIDSGSRIQYATWYAEILKTLAYMVARPTFFTSDIDIVLVRDRLIKTRRWIEKYGIRVADAVAVPGLPNVYRGFSVLSDSPDEARDRSIDVQRMTDDFTNPVAFTIQTDYDKGVYNRPQYQWWALGKQGDYNLHKILYGLKGRAVPIWLPTNMADLILKESVASASLKITVEEVGYTQSGGPRRSRQHIMIRLVNGTNLMREIVSSNVAANHSEVLTLDRPLRSDVKINDVIRISFMDLMRLDQDGVQIEHTADNNSVTAANTVFKSVKNTRRAVSTAY